MNIRQFKEGDIITRNEPVTHKHSVSTDSSFCGDRMELLGHDETAKVIFLKENGRLHESPIDLSYARDAWDEGWCNYPETLWQRIKARFPTPPTEATSDSEKGV